MSKRIWIRNAAIVAVLGFAVFLVLTQVLAFAPDAGQAGGPIAGLTPEQLRLFYATKETFKHDFTVEEGLGPIYDALSCYECHGKPNMVAGEGKDVITTGVLRMENRIGPKARKPLKDVIAYLTQDDVDRMFIHGGPVISRKSITAEFPTRFPKGCVAEPVVVPPGTELLAIRHAGPLWGMGLIEAIPDPDIAQNIFKELAVNPKLSGRLAGQMDQLVEVLRIGRFGSKAQLHNLIHFTSEAMKTDHGVTTMLNPYEHWGSDKQLPGCLHNYLPDEPNDPGFFLVKLTYFQELLAPPPRGEINDQTKRGEKLFANLQCSVCHMPEMYTGPVVKVPDPNSPIPRLRWMEVKALENQPVKAYSDFLLHQMGTGLADGVPLNGAMSGEWRTAPLWGLRMKTFFMHDGRTKDLTEAITLHSSEGSQAKEVIANFQKLPSEQKDDLIAFLKSL